MNIYERADKFGCYLEATCVNCGGAHRWEQLMEGHTRADSKKVHRIAKSIGIVEGFNAKNNPYHQYKTKTHLIFVHSCIEHFIKVNQ